jgi:ribonuclease G
MGVICRTVGAGKKEKFFQRDIDMLLAVWSRVQEKFKQLPAPCCVYEEPALAERSLRDFLSEDVDEIVSDSPAVIELAQDMFRRMSRRERVRIKHYRGTKPLFAKYNLSQQIDNIFRRQVPLPSGGYICIDETEALVAIDVNSGKNRSGKDLPETIVNTNLEAVDEIARQLRLRNVGGLIIIDLIDMRSRRDQHKVYRSLKQALMSDRARTRAYPISSLGLVEMTRQREQESVLDTVFSTCPYCEGKGMVKSATSMSVEIQRRLQQLLRRNRGTVRARVTVPPPILERMKNEDADLLQSLENDFGGELIFRADPALHMEEFHITDMQTGERL